MCKYPAEYVSWYDAIAYCNWLTDNLDYKITLPTELEWAMHMQAAARNMQVPGKDRKRVRVNTTRAPPLAIHRRVHLRRGGPEMR